MATHLEYAIQKGRNERQQETDRRITRRGGGRKQAGLRHKHAILCSQLMAHSFLSHTHIVQCSHTLPHIIHNAQARLLKTSSVLTHTKAINLAYVHFCSPSSLHTKYQIINLAMAEVQLDLAQEFMTFYSKLAAARMTAAHNRLR